MRRTIFHPALFNTFTHVPSPLTYITYTHRVHTLFRRGVRRDIKILDLPGALKWQMATDDGHPPLPLPGKKRY